ncbi:unnamed protein product, partial [Closterium sp. NIES-53]
DSGAQSGESSSLPSSPVEEGSENSSLPASPPSSPSPASEAPSEWPALDVSQPPDVMVGSLQVKYWATWLDDRYETSRPDMPGYLWAKLQIPGGHGADMEEDEKDGEVLVVMRVRVDGKHLRAVGSSHVIGLNRTVTLNEIGGSRAAIHPRQGMDFVFAVVPHK